MYNFDKNSLLPLNQVIYYVVHIFWEHCCLHNATIKNLYLYIVDATKVECIWCMNFSVYFIVFDFSSCREWLQHYHLIQMYGMQS